MASNPSDWPRSFVLYYDCPYLCLTWEDPFEVTWSFFQYIVLRPTDFQDWFSTSSVMGSGGWSRIWWRSLSSSLPVTTELSSHVLSTIFLPDLLKPLGPAAKSVSVKVWVGSPGVSLAASGTPITLGTWVSVIPILLIWLLRNVFCVWFCYDRCPYKECHHFLLVVLPLVSMREGFTLFAFNSIPQRAPFPHFCIIYLKPAYRGCWS